MLMKRADFEKQEREVLATYAQMSCDSRGREHPEPEHAFRTSFQRDVDRIVHSKAFRRLEYKTQVFVNYEGDHYRTRLTHTFEVAQVAISIARALCLNTSLTEAIALAHDLGHTPFGHAGEDILNELMQDCGGFEHNRQSLRVVEHLETRYPSFPGLNLTYEVREGILKHASAYDAPRIDQFEPDSRPTLEAQAVNVADELAYNCHDLEDGIRAGILLPEDLNRIQLWTIACRGIDMHSVDDGMLRYLAVRNLKDEMVRDVLQTSHAAIEASGVASIGMVRRHPRNLIRFSDPMQAMIRELSGHLLTHFYLHHRIVRMTTKAKWFLKDLFLRYNEIPRLLPEKIQRLHQSASPTDRKRIICDYVAGMTDRFALDEYKKLVDPNTPV